MKCAWTLAHREEKREDDASGGPVRQAKQNDGDENKEYERAGTRRAAEVTELKEKRRIGQQAE